jgi:hypothetical protein
MSANAEVLQGSVLIGSPAQETALPQVLVLGQPDWNPESFAREQIRGLVRRVFFSRREQPINQVVFMRPGGAGSGPRDERSCRHRRPRAWDGRDGKLVSSFSRDSCDQILVQSNGDQPVAGAGDQERRIWRGINERTPLAFPLGGAAK